MTSSIRRAQLGELEACQTGIMSKLLGLHEQVPIALSRVQLKLLQVLILFEDSGNDLTVAFNKWDINGDGSLEGVELWRGLQKMGGYFETIPVEEIEDLVLKLDLDGNGTIEAEEICEFVRMGRNTLAVQPLRRALERGLLVPQDRPSKVCWSSLRAQGAGLQENPLPPELWTRGWTGRERKSKKDKDKEEKGKKKGAKGGDKDGDKPDELPLETMIELQRIRERNEAQSFEKMAERLAALPDSDDEEEEEEEPPPPQKGAARGRPQTKSSETRPRGTPDKSSRPPSQAGKKKS